MSRFVLSSLACTGLAALAACGGANENQCPQGQSWDGQSCVGMAPQCPPGQMWNGAMCAATGGMGGQCPAGQSWNGAACVPMGGGQCPAGQSWNGAACVPAGGTAPQCPAGQSWNGSACVAGGPGPAAGGACSPAQQTNLAAVAPLLGAFTGQYVPAGARPVGQAITGNLQAGQCVEMPIQLQPSKCYTVVAAGQPGAMQNLDVQIIPTSPIPGIPITHALAEDQTQDAVAVLDGKPNCYHAPPFISVAAELVVRASAGQGVFAAQMYEK